ncbi:MAG: tetratricopeptide repeat protein [Planctomycetota bacterium]|jgi:tetratricopeptide (TPR) repeat protein|nr:tetratricopeptide repeat protein [Planctomycetota bacterium]MDP7253633.1 tetratricopeptide repeat protein [Planctomycetota bacterium]
MNAKPALLIALACMPLFGEEAKVRTPREEAEIQLSMANALYARSMFPQATQAFEAFFKMPESYIHEKRHEALYRCGESLIKLNKYSEAVGRYDTLIRNYEKSSFFNNALFRRGTLRFLLKDPGRAIDDLEKLVKLLPNDKKATPKLVDSTNYFLGLAFMAKNRLNDARPYLAIVSKNKASEHRKEALKYLADLDFRQESWDKAVLDYEAYRKDFPGDKENIPLIDYRLGRAYRELKLYDKAVAALRRIPPKHEYHTTAMSIEIDSFFQEEKFSDVLKSFSRLEKIYPPESDFRKKDDFGTLLYMAGISHFKLKQYKDVVKRFGSLRKLFPKHPKLETTLYLTCMSHYYLGDKEGSTAAAKLFLETFPESKENLSDVRYIYGDSLYSLKRYKAALPFLQIIPETSEFHQSAALRIALSYNELAQQESEHTENLTGAAEAYDYFVKKYPEAPSSANCLLSSADIYQKLQQYPLAEQRFNQFLANYGEKADKTVVEHSMYSRGQCQLVQKKYEAMATSFATLLRSFPKTKHATYCQYWIGIHYEKIGDWENAIIRFLPVTRDKEHQYSDDAIRRLAVCYYKAKKQNEAADTFFRIFKERQKIVLPDNFGNWVARHYAANKRVKDAIWLYEHLLANRPDTKYKNEFQYMLHTHYFNLKDWKKSAKWGTELLNTLDKTPDPRISKPKVLFQTAYCYYHDSIKGYKKAESYFLQLMKEKADADLMNETEFWLGKLYRRTGEYKKALDKLLQIGLTMPKFGAEAQYEAGLCWLEMADPEKIDIKTAIPHLENLVRLWEGTGEYGLLNEYPDYEKTDEVKKLLLEAKNRLAKYKAKQ